MPVSGQSQTARGPWLWPLLLIIMGAAGLLNNFLLPGDRQMSMLWPLLLVVAGACILLQGDFRFYSRQRSFGITRGSVESATLAISAGEIDVSAQAFASPGRDRLITGHYAGQSRPELHTKNSHAVLDLQRSQTPWYNLSDWELLLARDLPWKLLIATHLGQIQLDLSHLILSGGRVSTGIGDIRVVAPRETLGALKLNSALGHIHVITPDGYRTRIRIAGGRFFGTHADESRYHSPEPDIYESTNAHDDAPVVDIEISGTFGDAYLA